MTCLGASELNDEIPFQLGFASEDNFIGVWLTVIEHTKASVFSNFSEHKTNGSESSFAQSMMPTKERI